MQLYHHNIKYCVSDCETIDEYKNGTFVKYFEEPSCSGRTQYDISGLTKDQGIPDTPLLLYHGEKDTMASIEQAQRVYDNWSDWGIGSFEFAALTGLGCSRMA